MLAAAIAAVDLSPEEEEDDDDEDVEERTELTPSATVLLTLRARSTCCASVRASILCRNTSTMRSGLRRWAVVIVSIRRWIAAANSGTLNGSRLFKLTRQSTTNTIAGHRCNASSINEKEDDDDVDDDDKELLLFFAKPLSVAVAAAVAVAVAAELFPSAVLLAVVTVAVAVVACCCAVDCCCCCSR